MCSNLKPHLPQSLCPEMYSGRFVGASEQTNKHMEILMIKITVCDDDPDVP